MPIYIVNSGNFPSKLSKKGLVNRGIMHGETLKLQNIKANEQSMSGFDTIQNEVKSCVSKYKQLHYNHEFADRFFGNTSYHVLAR